MPQALPSGVAMPSRPGDGRIPVQRMPIRHYAAPSSTRSLTVECVFVFSGEGEPQQPFAEAMIRLAPNVLGRGLSVLGGTLVRLLRNPGYWHPSLLMSFCTEGIARFSRYFHVELTRVFLFNYIEWNEDEVLRTVQQECGWRKPDWSPTTWRSDCEYLLKQYLYKQTLGFTKNDDLLSGLVRDGQISRGRAEKARGGERNTQIFPG